MNLKLSELFSSIPPEFSLKDQFANARLYSYKDREILISWWKNGNPNRHAFFKSSILHRPSEDGPADTTWHVNGQVKEVSYYNNGRRCRPSLEGPAFKHWSDLGQIESIVYFSNGLYHRPVAEGPAIEAWKDGRYVQCRYFENNVKIK